MPLAPWRLKPSSRWKKRPWRKAPSAPPVLRLAFYGKANTTTEEGPVPPKNPETTPDMAATYCLPPSP